MPRNEEYLLDRKQVRISVEHLGMLKELADHDSRKVPNMMELLISAAYKQFKERKDDRPLRQE